eukprot:TRINITY_DN90498_c0_g1_i1.p1 TRINITY_DN90498_c0_g1~~TRINITY_DN90498_c0_g1_i1.p1  ORF type:complete len:1462 (-),score=355.19 TRINITY_DN90498_c0_g1_i1:319-4704(-)
MNVMLPPMPPVFVAADTGATAELWVEPVAFAESPACQKAFTAGATAGAAAPVSARHAQELAAGTASPPLYAIGCYSPPAVPFCRDPGVADVDCTVDHLVADPAEVHVRQLALHQPLRERLSDMPPEPAAQEYWPQLATPLQPSEHHGHSLGMPQGGHAEATTHFGRGLQPHTVHHPAAAEQSQSLLRGLEWTPPPARVSQGQQQGRSLRTPQSSQPSSAAAPAFASVLRHPSSPGRHAQEALSAMPTAQDSLQEQPEALQRRWRRGGTHEAQDRCGPGASSMTAPPQEVSEACLEAHGNYAGLDLQQLVEAVGALAIVAESAPQVAEAGAEEGDDSVALEVSAAAERVQDALEILVAERNHLWEDLLLAEQELREMKTEVASEKTQHDASMAATIEELQQALQASQQHEQDHLALTSAQKEVRVLRRLLEDIRSGSSMDQSAAMLAEATAEAEEGSHRQAWPSLAVRSGEHADMNQEDLSLQASPQSWAMASARQLPESPIDLSLSQSMVVPEEPSALTARRKVRGAASLDVSDHLPGHSQLASRALWYSSYQVSDSDSDSPSSPRFGRIDSAVLKEAKHAITVPRVAEASQALFLEMQKEVVAEVVVVASCFHAWRRACFERRWLAQRQDAETVVWRQEYLLYRIALGCLRASMRSCMCMWHSWASSQRAAKEKLSVSRQFVASGLRSAKRVCFLAWRRASGLGKKMSAVRKALDVNAAFHSRVCLRLWNAAVADRRALERRQSAATSAVQRFLQSFQSASTASCWSAWKSLAAEHRFLAQQHESLSVQLGTIPSLKAEARQQKASARRRLVWLMTVGKLGEIMRLWRGLVQVGAARRRRCGMLSGVFKRSGDAASLRQSYWAWRATAAHEGLAAKQGAVLEEKLRESQQLLASYEAAAAQAAVLKRKQAYTRAALLAAAGQRASLLEKGLTSLCFARWHAKRCAAARRRASEDLVAFACTARNALMLHVLWRGWQSLVSTSPTSIALRVAEAAVAPLRSALLCWRRQCARVRNKAVVEHLIRGAGCVSDECLVAWIFAVWQRHNEAEAARCAAAAHCKEVRASARVVAMHFCAKARSGELRSYLGAWKSWVDLAPERRLEETRHARGQWAEEQLRRRVLQVWLSDGWLMVGHVFEEWRRALEACSAEWDLQKREADQHRELAAAVSKQRAKTESAVLRACRSFGRVQLRQCWCAWISYRLASLAERHAERRTTVVRRYSAFTVRRWLQADVGLLLARCFSELAHHARAERSVRGLEWTAQCRGEEQQRNLWLEEQLKRAYEQLDHTAESLQQELKSKEDLAAELRAAYGQLRRANLHSSSAGAAAQRSASVSAATGRRSVDMPLRKPSLSLQDDGSALERSGSSRGGGVRSLLGYEEQAESRNAVALVGSAGKRRAPSNGAKAPPPPSRSSLASPARLRLPSSPSSAAAHRQGEAWGAGVPMSLMGSHRGVGGEPRVAA